MIFNCGFYYPMWYIMITRKYNKYCIEVIYHIFNTNNYNSGLHDRSLSWVLDISGLEEIWCRRMKTQTNSNKLIIQPIYMIVNTVRNISGVSCRTSISLATLKVHLCQSAHVRGGYVIRAFILRPVHT